MYVCGPTVYDVARTHRARPGQPDLRHVLRRYLSFIGLQAVHHVAPTSPMWTTRSSSGPTSWGGPSVMWRPNSRRCGGSRWQPSVTFRPTTSPTPPGTSRTWLSWWLKLPGQAASPTRHPMGFTSKKCPRSKGYGLLARQQSLESLQAGARVEANDDKRSTLAFALWKKGNEGEPSWESPWGPGRPGWHTECVVMSLDLLGEGFDLHGGGQDLKFPHHENERAQAVADGKVFAQHWMHHGWVVVEGTKMSKSLGNFSTLPDLLSRVTTPAPIASLVLRAHYRSPIEVTLRDAGRRREGARAARHVWLGASAWGDLVEARRPTASSSKGSSRRHRSGRRSGGRLPRAHGRRPRHPGRAGRHLRAGERGELEG